MKIKNDYNTELSRMGLLIDDFLTAEKPPIIKTLVQSLLNLISADASISENQNFYATEDGNVVTKNNLLKEKEINLPALLL